MNKELARKVLEKNCFEFENDADFENVVENHISDGSLTEHVTPKGIKFLWFIETDTYPYKESCSTIGVEKTGDVFFADGNLDLPKDGEWELCDLMEAIDKKYRNDKKYQVEYKNIKVAYTPEALEKAAAGDLVLDAPDDDNDYLRTAVFHFCHTHFMYCNAAHLDQYDAETRGRRLQEWEYQPNGTFRGRIYARVIEK